MTRPRLKKTSRTAKDEPEKFFFRGRHEILESRRFKKLSSSAIRLYLYLLKMRNRYADEKGHFWRSDVDLARDSGLTEKTISQAKKRLKNDGFITFEIATFLDKKTLKTTIYRILD